MTKSRSGIVTDPLWCWAWYLLHRKYCSRW